MHMVKKVIKHRLTTGRHKLNVQGLTSVRAGCAAGCGQTPHQVCDTEPAFVESTRTAVGQEEEEEGEEEEEEEEKKEVMEINYMCMQVNG